MKDLTHYSAISFVVALLALPGLASATPADVSGDYTAEGSRNTVQNEPIAATYLALNQYPVTAPKMSVVTIDSGAKYDDNFLDDLDEKMSVELESMINVLDF